MINIKLLASVIDTHGANPTQHTSFVDQGGIDYMLGALFILLGIGIFLVFNKKAKTKMLDYKKRQLEEYNKNRGTKVTDYSNTRLYLPFWERAKFITPIMLTALFVMVGIFFIVWTAKGAPITTM